MKTIWKWILDCKAPSQTVEMPFDTRLLSVAAIGEQVFLWGVCDPDAPKRPHRIIISTSGHELPTNCGAFLGTVILKDGHITLHVFDGHNPLPESWLENDS